MIAYTYQRTENQPIFLSIHARLPQVGKVNLCCLPGVDRSWPSDQPRQNWIKFFQIF